MVIINYLVINSSIILQKFLFLHSPEKFFCHTTNVFHTFQHDLYLNLPYVTKKIQLTKIIPNYILLTVFKPKNQQYNHI